MKERFKLVLRPLFLRLSGYLFFTLTAFHSLFL